MDLASDTWNCGRAAVIKSQLPAGSNIKITTGGGITIQTSLAEWAFTCPHFDIISVHDYGTDVYTSMAALSAGQARAKALGKQVVFEEWGASGVNKAAVVGAFLPALQKAGIPNLIWEITKPVRGLSPWILEPD
jgi:hypothetical protein